MNDGNAVTRWIKHIEASISEEKIKELTLFLYRKYIEEKK